MCAFAIVKDHLNTDVCTGGFMGQYGHVGVVTVSGHVLYACEYAHLCVNVCAHVLSCH